MGAALYHQLLSKVGAGPAKGFIATAHFENTCSNTRAGQVPASWCIKFLPYSSPNAQSDQHLTCHWQVSVTIDRIPFLAQRSNFPSSRSLASSSMPPYMHITLLICLPKKRGRSSFFRGAGRDNCSLCAFRLAP